MTDKRYDAKAWDINADPDGFNPKSFVARDWALDDVLDFTVFLPGSTENSFGLSVIADGALVSGTVIHGIRWAELLVEQLRTAGPNSEDISKALDKTLAEDIRKHYATADERREAGIPNPSHSFLHFEKARVHSGAGVVDYPLFRVQMKSVSGWGLGTHVIE